MPSFWLVAILSCIRNAFFGLVYSLCQKIIGCIPYTEIWSSQISNKLFLNLETSTRWHSLFFPKSQLVVPYTAFLVRDNACNCDTCATQRPRFFENMTPPDWNIHLVSGMVTMASLSFVEATKESGCFQMGKAKIWPK